MAKHRVLQSVAKSLADSFTSLMNYGDDDYVLGHLLSAARESGLSTLNVDLLTGQAEPPELLIAPVVRSIRSYCEFLPTLGERSGSDCGFVKKARLRLSFDLAVSRPAGWSNLMESPFVCEIVITDERGKRYAGKNEGWWYPEGGKLISPSKPA